MPSGPKRTAACFLGLSGARQSGCRQSGILLTVTRGPWLDHDKGRGVSRPRGLSLPCRYSRSPAHSRGLPMWLGCLLGDRWGTPSLTVAAKSPRSPDTGSGSHVPGCCLRLPFSV